MKNPNAFPMGNKFGFFICGGDYGTRTCDLMRVKRKATTPTNVAALRNRIIYPLSRKNHLSISKHIVCSSESFLVSSSIRNGKYALHLKPCSRTRICRIPHCFQLTQNLLYFTILRKTGTRRNALANVIA